MKKLYTLLGTVLMVGAVNAQVYFGKDFEDQSITSGGCTNQTIVGTANWFAGSFSSNNFAKMSNYSGGSNTASETWFITPSIDLTSATSPIFSFSSASKFSGADILVFTSVDYDGTSDPNIQGTWTAMSPALSPGNYAWTNSGELAVPNTSATTYFAFKYTGTNTDGKTWELDSLFVAETGEAFQTTVIVTPPATVSVYDIQYTTAVPAVSPYDGQTVNTGGIVTHVRTDNKGFYISSGTGPFSGVYVYSTLTPSPVAVGDSVTFEAQVAEFNELTELKFPNNLTVVSSNNFFLATPVTTVNALTEAYEGCFVAACGNCTAADNNFGDWMLNDGSGDASIGDFFFANTGTQGTSYNVKGIIDFAFSNFQWLPRNAADVQSTTSCASAINENTVQFGIYPNPANTTLNIDVDGKHNVTVLDMNGRVINNMVANGFTTINVANLDAGVYFINIDGTMAKFVKK